MIIQPLADQLFIGTQINDAEDIAQITKLGIRTVICNRPDQEEPGQPTFATVQQWLADAGIQNIVLQAVTAPAITAADGAKLEQLLADAEQPVLTYCRTGTRCALLWGFGQAKQGRPVAEIIAAATAAGVDISGAEARLQAEQS
ncbi:MAG: TIGR01244 family sulfur transferase [Neisseria sp.]